MPLLDAKGGLGPFSLPKSVPTECKKRRTLPVSDHITNRSVLIYPRGAFVTRKQAFGQCLRRRTLQGAGLFAGRTAPTSRPAVEVAAIFVTGSADPANGMSLAPPPQLLAPNAEWVRSHRVVGIRISLALPGRHWKVTPRLSSVSIVADFNLTV